MCEDCHTWYLSQAPQAVPVENFLSCGEISSHDRFSCGEILHMTWCYVENALHMRNVKKSVMWRNFLHNWWFFVALNCCKIIVLVIYAILSRIFCRDLRTFVWRKIEPKIFVCGEKRTNIMFVYLGFYNCQTFHLVLHPSSGPETLNAKFWTHHPEFVHSWLMWIFSPDYLLFLYNQIFQIKTLCELQLH